MNNNQSEDILVTIITPVYNGEATIARTIDSVLSQDYPNIEYIIRDGNSSDNTVEIASRYKDKFTEGKKLKIISEDDEGLYDALNKGVLEAKGIIIGNINADDWYEPFAVREMVQLYEREIYDIAWADLLIHGNKQTFRKRARVGKVMTTAHFCHPTMFCKKEILLKYPYLSKHMDDDFDMVLRAKKNGAKIVIINKILAHYTLGGMTTQSGFRNMINRINIKYKTYRRNGYSVFYWFYCVFIEGVKQILAH